MSLRVLIIPEDGRHNGFILKPLIERMLVECERPNAKVRMLSDPRLRGYAAARQCVRARFYERNMDDLWLFLPDADKAAGLSDLEAEGRAKGVTLLCCAARPEVEAWLLAGHREKLGLSWANVVSHPRLKEEVFTQFIASFGNPSRPGMNRESLMLETLSNYRGLLAVCPELAELERRIRSALA